MIHVNLTARRISTAYPTRLSKRRLTNPSTSIHLSLRLTSTVQFSTASRSLLQQSQSNHASKLANRSEAEAEAESTIAILGGGISGLSTALYLNRSLSASSSSGTPYKIILVEKEDRLGGWVKSERVKMKGETNETALLESGPRSLRPAGHSGMVMLELIKSLNLFPRLLKVSKSSPSAKNRFIYYPNSLARLPSSLLSAILALRLPVLKGLIPSILSEPFITSRFIRPKSESPLEISRQRTREALLDESVHDFLVRRFGNRSSIPENLVSAVLHGIYAGDSRKLSVRAVLPFLWNSEKRNGSLIRGLLPKKWNKRFREPNEKEKLKEERGQRELEEVEERLGEEFVREMKDVSVYSFPEGIEEITRAMRVELEKDQNVEIWSGTKCQTIGAQGGNGLVEVQTSSGALQCSRVISALPSNVLSSILDPTSIPPQALSLLSHNPSSNVGVVNVAIPSNSIKSGERLLGKIEGFGYLVPRSTPGNKDGILGVVFDSDSLPGQDKSSISESDSKVPTKFTVMMGGTTHWPTINSKTTETSIASSLPNEEELKEAALKALSSQLGIPKDVLESENTLIKASLQLNAIPQYLVGHPVRMKTLHDLLSKTNEEGKSWGKTLTLVGASYTGVSLNDCVSQSEKTVKRLFEGGLKGSITGLEEFDSLS